MSQGYTAKGKFTSEILKDMSVAVAGLGGTGSSVTQMLVRMGLKHLTIADPDTVSETNVSRQICYAESDIGRTKAEACTEFLKKISSHCEIKSHEDLVSDSNAERVIGKPDIIFDCTDNVRSRLTLNRYSVRIGISEIFVSSEYNFAQVKGIIPGKTSCMDCFASGSVMTTQACSAGNVLETMPVMAGLLAVNVMLSIMNNTYNGEMIVLDGTDYTMEKIRIDRNPDCKTCGR